MSSENKDSMAVSPHPPRLAHMVQTPSFKGYGFNLHTIKNRTGQFIGQVDEGSPAEKAMLKQGDKIIEVNGANITSENHKQVVTRIKMVENETKLLVIDDDGEQWYREHNIVVTGDLTEVSRASNIVRRPSTSSSSNEEEAQDKEDSASLASQSSSEHHSSRQEVSELDGKKPSEKEDTVCEQEPSLVNGQEDKSNVSLSSDDDESIAQELIQNIKLDEESSSKTNGSAEDHEEKIIAEQNLKNSETESSVPEESEDVKENVVTTIPSIEINQEGDSSSCKSVSNGGSRRSTGSISSASSRESGVNSQRTNPVVDKSSPMSSSPTPPSSVGSPSPTPAPTPAYNKNIDGLNMNMSAADMRAYLASKKKKDIRHNTDIDLRKKYEIVQRL